MCDINTLANKCDAAILAEDLNGISDLINKIESELDSLDNVEYRNYKRYFLGNLYSSLSTLKSESFEIKKEEKPKCAIKAIDNYRDAFKDKANLDITTRLRTQANLALIYKKCKRYIEAIQLCKFDDRLPNNSDDYQFIARCIWRRK